MSVLKVNQALNTAFYCSCGGAEGSAFAVTEKAKGNFYCSVKSALSWLVRGFSRVMRRWSRWTVWSSGKFCSAMIHFTGVRRL